MSTTMMPEPMEVTLAKLLREICGKGIHGNPYCNDAVKDALKALAVNGKMHRFDAWTDAAEITLKRAGYVRVNKDGEPEKWVNTI